MAKVPKMSASDIAYAKKELEAWRDSQRGRRLTWALIAKTTGFSRQTLSAHADIYKLFDEAKKALSSGKRPRPAQSDDYLTDRIAHLQSELDRYRKLESEWLERWVRIAYHARGKRTSLEELDKPLPPVQRK
jgi:hypothetical protein